MERPRKLMSVEPLPNIMIQPQAMEAISNGTMCIPGVIETKFSARNLRELGPLGSGSFGSVSKMLHIESGKEMAVKRIRYQNITHVDQERLIREQNTIMKSSSKNIVQFFGVIFHEGDCWICMELMTVCLDRLYRYVYKETGQNLSVKIIGHITVSTINALEYLNTTLKIMHRDVKPSNVLINHDGLVKLCDFGICGELKDSIVKTHDVGCQPYLSPERITKQEDYGVRSDVWSLGITIYEITTGQFPYPEWTSPFEQIEYVVKGDPPVLPFSEKEKYPVDLCHFINSCLTKELKERPSYGDLMKKDFYKNNVKCEEATREQLGIYAQDTLQFTKIM